MFTVRVERAGGREVLECTRYKVKTETGRARIEITREILDVMAVAILRDESILIGPGERAFVMNAHGDTVDRIIVAREV